MACFFNFWSATITVRLSLLLKTRVVELGVLASLLVGVAETEPTAVDDVGLSKSSSSSEAVSTRSIISGMVVGSEMRGRRRGQRGETRQGWRSIVTVRVCHNKVTSVHNHSCVTHRSRIKVKHALRLVGVPHSVVPPAPAFYLGRDGVNIHLSLREGERWNSVRCIRHKYSSC